MLSHCRAVVIGNLQVTHMCCVTNAVRLVLDFFRSGKFKNWGLLSDKELTLKTLFLVALASGKRRSELHVLSADVRWLKGGVRTAELVPLSDFISKTHLSSAGLGALRPIQIRALDDVAGPEGIGEKLLCPVRSLRFYLDRSHIAVTLRRDCSFPIEGAWLMTYLNRQSRLI